VKGLGLLSETKDEIISIITNKAACAEILVTRNKRNMNPFMPQISPKHVLR
jgi:uncharacterized protein (UPF0210 family)